MTNHRLFAVLMTCGLAVGFSGCGGGGSDTPDLGDVNGTVTLDGKAAPNLTVTFQPTEGRPSSGVTNESGEYTLKYSPSETGAKVGEHLVTISSNPPEQDGDCCEPPAEDFVDPIPPKYNTDAANNSEMKKTVEAGSNTFDFPLKSDPNAAKNKPSSARRNAGDCCDY